MARLSTADELREQAKRYQFAAMKILEAAKILEGKVITPPSGQLSFTSLPPDVRISKIGGKSERLEALLSYFKTNGPAYRKDILKETNIPSGTISFLLRKREYFDRDERGRWILRNGMEEEK